MCLPVQCWSHLLLEKRQCLHRMTHIIFFAGVVFRGENAECLSGEEVEEAADRNQCPPSLVPHSLITIGYNRLGKLFLGRCCWHISRGKSCMRVLSLQFSELSSSCSPILALLFTPLPLLLLLPQSVGMKWEIKLWHIVQDFA